MADPNTTPTFIVHAPDGTIIDVIPPDELNDGPHPWSEAACWAHLARIQYEQHHTEIGSTP